MKEDIGVRLDGLINRLDGAHNALAGKHTAGHSIITISAGGVGIWLAVTACAVMLACNLFLAVLYIDQQSQIRQLNEFLSAIYMIAPQLKPKGS